MAKRERIIEGSWTCSECGTEGIPGREKACPSCGATREHGEAKFDFGGEGSSGRREAATVEDADALSLAQAGKDWYCFYCGGSNRGDADRCAVCGAERKETTPRDAAAKRAQHETPAPKSSGGGMGLFALAVLGGVILLCAGIAFWATRTSESDGRVTDLHWERSITVETFTQSTEQGWRSDLTLRPSVMPRNGAGEVSGVDDLRFCNRKERTPEKCSTKTRKEACGTEEKCHTEDLGNGFAKEVCEDVTKYCEEKYEECEAAVWDEWCTYDTWKWKAGQAVAGQGDDASPIWPDAPTAGSLDRLVREEAYTVTVAWDDQEHLVKPTSEKEFAAWKVGQPVIVEVNNLGSVTDVRPKP